MFPALKLKFAARRYARRLPSALRRGWGASGHYSPAQIIKAAESAGLDLTYIAIGYAAFLPGEQFDLLRAEMPVALSYDEARAIYLRSLSRLPPSSGEWEPAPERLDYPPWGSS